MTTTSAYTEAQIREMLAAAARISGDNIRAVTHLILFTDLPSHPLLQRFLDVQPIGDGGQLATGAWVRDYPGLKQALGSGLYQGLDRVLTLAQSLQEGTPIDLREVLRSFGGHAHARVAVEACLIATGYGDWYQVTGTQVLDQHLADQRELLGE